MKTGVVLGILAMLLPRAGSTDEKEVARLQACADVLDEMVRLPEGVPRKLLDKAYCVIVIPGVKKAALGVGGRAGWGAAACRTANGDGAWSGPQMVSLKGGSFGLQIGGESSDFVLLVMDRKGIDHLLRSKFTLGADASIAAGPLGRNAEAATDLTMRAEILSYSRSRGIFAGISLEGASLARDKKGQSAIYGKRTSPNNPLLEPGDQVPSAARVMVRALERLSPRRAG